MILFIKKLKNTKHAGLSLLETMLVFVLISVVLVGVIQLFRTLNDRSKINNTKTMVRAIQSGIENFHVDISRYPIQLNELITPPSDNNEKRRWQGPYVPKEYNKDGSIKDVWGNDFEYKLAANKSSYEISSWGPNGVNAETGHIIGD